MSNDIKLRRRHLEIHLNAVDKSYINSNRGRGGSGVP